MRAEPAESAPHAANAATIVVPVYNEAERIEAVVAEIVDELGASGRPFSVLILNDGSTDWSEALESRLLSLGPVVLHSHHTNEGKGAVLGRAFPGIDTALGVVIDADGEYLPRDIPALLAPLERGEADWVLGSRYGFGRPRPRQYWATYRVNRLVNLSFALLSGQRTQDLLTGLYAFRTALVRDVRLRERRFSYTAELMWKLRHRGVRLTEVPVGYRFRSYAEGKKIRWWETGTILLAMLRYRFAGRPRSTRRERA